MEKLTLNVAEAAKLVGLDKMTIYALSKTSGFPAITIGRRVIIPREALVKWLNDKATKA